MRFGKMILHAFYFLPWISPPPPCNITTGFQAHRHMSKLPAGASIINNYEGWRMNMRVESNSGVITDRPSMCSNEKQYHLQRLPGMSRYPSPLQCNSSPSEPLHMWLRLVLWVAIWKTVYIKVLRDAIKMSWTAIVHQTRQTS